MTPQPQTQDSREDSIVLPAMVWLAVQLFALVLASGRVPLWARFDPPFERYALHLMCAAQLAASAVLFPWLMSNLRARLFTILFALPFLALSTLLARLTTTDFAVASAMMTLWLASLALWQLTLSTRKAQLTGVAIASATIIGGGCLIYLSMDFNGSSFPIQRLNPWLWIGLVVNGGSAAIAARISRQLIHRHKPTYPQPAC